MMMNTIYDFFVHKEYYYIGYISLLTTSINNVLLLTSTCLLCIYYFELNMIISFVCINNYFIRSINWGQSIVFYDLYTINLLLLL